MRFWALILVACGLLACGKDKGKDEKAPITGASTAGGGGEQAAPPQSKALGLESVTSWSWPYGKGAKDYKAAVEAAKKKDWAAVVTACEAAIGKDVSHLDAQYLAARALAQLGRHPEALAHLDAALAGDWVQFGPRVEKDPDLAPLLASPVGAQVKERVASYRDELGKRARAGLLVTGLRSGFKAPKSEGTQTVLTRGELYALDPETRRFLRLTDTHNALAAYLVSPSGDEVAYLYYTKVQFPSAGAPAFPAIIKNARVGVIRLDQPGMPAKEASFKDARTFILQYAAGDELLVTSHDILGWWDLGAAKTWSIDKTTGQKKALKKPPAAGEKVIVRYEGVEREGRPVDGIDTNWAGGSSKLVLTATQKTVEMPEGHAAAREGVVWAPDGKHLAVATAVDPCASGWSAALYLVDAGTGKLLHLATGASSFDARFLADGRLAYLDEKRALHLYDVATGREQARLQARGGFSFAGAGASGGPLCKREPFDESEESGDVESGEFEEGDE